MNALRLIKRNHKRIGELLNRLIEIPEYKESRKQELFEELRSELLSFLSVENEMFLQILSAQSPVGLVEEFRKDHSSIRHLIMAMDKRATSDVKWREHLFDLLMLFEEYASGEEDMLFRKASRTLSHKEIRTLGSEMNERLEYLRKKSKAA